MRVLMFGCKSGRPGIPPWQDFPPVTACYFPVFIFFVAAFVAAGFFSVGFFSALFFAAGFFSAASFAMAVFAAVFFGVLSVAVFFTAAFLAVLFATGFTAFAAFPAVLLSRASSFVRSRIMLWILSTAPTLHACEIAPRDA